MASATSYNFVDGPLKGVPFKISQGSWTEDSAYKEGGYFASSVPVGSFVEVSGDWTVSVANGGDGDKVIGYTVALPSGSTTDRRVAVNVAGAYIKSFVINTDSLDIVAGDPVMVATSTKIAKATASSGAMALVGGKAGDTIPVLVFGPMMGTKAVAQAGG